MATFALHRELHKCRTRLQLVTALAAMTCAFVVLLAVAAIRDQSACFDLGMRLQRQARWSPIITCEVRSGAFWTRAMP